MHLIIKGTAQVTKFNFGLKKLKLYLSGWNMKKFQSTFFWVQITFFHHLSLCQLNSGDKFASTFRQFMILVPWEYFISVETSRLANFNCISPSRCRRRNWYMVEVMNKSQMTIASWGEGEWSKHFSASGTNISSSPRLGLRCESGREQLTGANSMSVDRFFFGTLAHK